MTLNRCSKLLPPPHTPHGDTSCLGGNVEHLKSETFFTLDRVKMGTRPFGDPGLRIIGINFPPLKSHWEHQTVSSRANPTFPFELGVKFAVSIQEVGMKDIQFTQWSRPKPTLLLGFHESRYQCLFVCVCKNPGNTTRPRRTKRT